MKRVDVLAELLAPEYGSLDDATDEARNTAYRVAGKILKLLDNADDALADIETAYEEGRAEGREEERESVVEWKRGRAVGFFNGGSFDLADMERHEARLIESGKHREGE